MKEILRYTLVVEDCQSDTYELRNNAYLWPLYLGRVCAVAGQSIATFDLSTVLDRQSSYCGADSKVVSCVI